jgi:tRNA pseudouridine13 synthase
MSTFVSLSDLPFALGAPQATATLRATAADFVVDEVLDIELDGEGEHLWLQVEKTGENTNWVAKLLARACDVPPRDVSFAGLKDRHAVTTQWFSVQVPIKSIITPAQLAEGLPETVRVLKMGRHRRKLKRGAHRGNRFVITLRDVDGERDDIERRLQAIVEQGFANYFGEQRFGREGGNLIAAQRLFSGELKRVDRNKRSLYLSAARSYLFNRVLGARIEDGSWRQVIVGERVMLDGSHSTFVAEEAELADLQARMASLDLHTTGPMCGRGDLPEREAALLADDAELRDGLTRERVDASRRALRSRARDLRWEWPEDNVLRLEFGLDSGCFATSMLREIVRWNGVEEGENE